MKRSVLLAIPMMVLLSLATFAQTTGPVLTRADYDRAASRLSFNTARLVDRLPGSPVWLDDGRFWYRVSTVDGAEFVLIDPSDGSRKAAASLDELGVESDGARSFGRAASATSPDGKYEAFIRDWNLWVKETGSGNEKQLTKNGIENYGYATDNAGWRKSDRPILIWSPDSKKIATYRQDQRHVSDMYLVSTNVGEPELQAWKYPLPQDEKIIQIERIIIDVESGKITPLKIPADARRGTLCDDISCTGAWDDNEWSEDGSTLAFVSSSRDHKEAKFRIANTSTGDVREVFEEVVSTQYESGQGAINWRYFPKTNEAIWYSERSDWGHLYLYDLGTGKVKNQITKGDWVVTRMMHVDEANRVIYFEANGRESGRDPYFSHFYKINFDGSGLKLLTPEDGNHRISISPDRKYFADSYSKPDVPPVAVLRDMDGKLISTVEKTSVERLKKTGWKPPMPITVKDRNNKWDLYGLMFTPSDLDESKKYPVINYIYPGPQGGGVGSRSFSPSRNDHNAVAELGFVVIVIDGSCNPDRSKSFHDACYGDMADNTLEDQMAGIKQLAQKYPYIDTSRVGVWGHSGGGFATASAMFKYPDFYKVGVSQSGNHDNRNYEDDWGERYIGLLKKEGDSDNYAPQANQVYAKNLKGKLMLAHGGLDDNVPPYNTYLVVDALIKANKDFDLIIFPNARHGYGADTLYMTRRRWDYFVKHLMGGEPPEQYELTVPRNQ
ncbi:MAG: S9 family peptidase [Acidobacteria bacterium]|nr:MAG: S9 family peptidase [Acidobacteriota bacterium]REJ99351.1 MAG: S9 family peptidase [Acidobacteriota bacterium]REK16479.1 MAG: S9 family peptidase [Acidobacteriota bacterium]REK44161.1 MAG: S9 family peptidase [Acidobacteriota bacterium]